ncbi:uncharacterized protein LOC126473449 isoform X4 [Schistocerca serialis cubense]|uniref:uncharacterized protein LOC126473449 isoform X4 n=1 Tax=Schistocerca serialis cubense TaxID=2023355 RepID=UPI00214F3725|nr:uncharacterized protein LOC126473449 isoform X4 [Schistocerca serialis cubense]
MAFAGAASLLKAPTMLEQLLEEINFQRTKEMRQLLKDDSGFVMLQGTTYWTDLFVRHFLFQTEHCIDCDDLLFFVRKRHVKGSSRYLPKFETEVDVFRKDSRKLPIGDPDIDWEETVYLNLIIHQFDYTLTLAICTRTSPNELQVLKRHSQKVYASPSRRRMDMKGEVEEMTYPHICFMVDNFDEVFCDILVRDGEMVCVELVASDRDGAIQGVIFLGSIRYDALKKVYDARSSLSSKMAQRMTFGLFSGATTQRVEFVRMKGPQGKGHAEMAVTKPKGSGAETPTSEPGLCATDMWDSDWDEDPEDFFVYTHRRRLSDPSANLNNFVRGGWKTKPYESSGPKSRSENEGLDSMANGVTEIEAGDVRDEAISRGQNSKSSSHRVKEYHSKSLPKKLKDSVNNRAKSYGRSMTPPCRFTPDGTLVNYWCDLPRRGPPGAHELDDGVYNPLWTMRGFTQTFHFWKESRRAQSVPLNAFLTYITLPWWSITKGKGIEAASYLFSYTAFTLKGYRILPLGHDSHFTAKGEGVLQISLFRKGKCICSNK